MTGASITIQSAAALSGSIRVSAAHSSGVWNGPTAIMVTAALACLYALRRRLLIATVSGFSMAPVLHPGDRLLVRRASLVRLRPGAIVVVEPDSRAAGPRPGSGFVIKRLAAVPGDPRPAYVPPQVGPQVPTGWFAILGDNPDASRDSRGYGLVSQERLVGVVIRLIGRRREVNRSDA